MPVSLELFKSVVGSFPAGVTIVTCRGADGVPLLYCRRAYAAWPRPAALLAAVGSGPVDAADWAFHWDFH